MDARRPKNDPTVEGSRAAPIGEAREEILRLIARLHGTGARDRPRAAQPPVDAPRRAERAATPSAGRASAERPPGTASELRRLRESLEERLSDARLAVRLGALEKRVARIDELLSGRRAEPPTGGGGEVEHTISGELRGQLMPDMLQLVSSNALTGVFVVRSGGTENRLYLEEGQICHAEGPGLEGESAFFASMAAEEGRYYFEETTDLPDKRTITGNTQFLILEALRKIDEGEAT